MFISAYIISLMVAMAVTHFLNAQGGLLSLFHTVRPGLRTKVKSRNALIEWSAIHWHPKTTKLLMCAFCQVSHLAFWVSMVVAWFSGLTLDQGCLLVVLSTVTAGWLQSFLRKDSPARQEHQTTGKPTPTQLKTPTKAPEVKKSPNEALDAHIELLKSRGYEIKNLPDGKYQVNHIPEREKFWLGFFRGEPDASVQGLAELYKKAEAEFANNPECTTCDKGTILNGMRDEALKLIDDHLKGP